MPHLANSNRAASLPPHRSVSHPIRESASASRENRKRKQTADDVDDEDCQPAFPGSWLAQEGCPADFKQMKTRIARRQPALIGKQINFPEDGRRQKQQLSADDDDL